MSAPPGEPPTFLRSLGSEEPLVTVELRPPRADLAAANGLDAWIDTHHAVNRLTRAGRFVFLTDNAVGTDEEENLAYLESNFADETDVARVVPFLTTKHSLEYCLTFAQRAWAGGVRAMTVLGGDQSVGPPRCVPHSYVLRRLIRDRIPGLPLGGWANPHGDPELQATYLTEPKNTIDFFLSQVASHHSARGVERLVRELEDRGTGLPGVYGIFYYRSANPATLERLGRFLPVPAEAITREFDAGATPQEFCARSFRALRDAGVRHVYVSNLPLRSAAGTVSNLPLRSAAGTLQEILERI
jgi:5,10-methylenetetrahydrofolate reductase